jgi:CubicO group peptidase (beta-lactamase class C family)
LGLTDTRINLSDEQRSRLARGHAAGKPVKTWDFDALAGAEALRSTARDMLRFLGANVGLRETPLSKALHATQGDRFETGELELFVALGWHVWTKYGTTIIWHNGGTGGYHVVREPTTGLALLPAGSQLKRHPPTGMTPESWDTGHTLLEPAPATIAPPTPHRQPLVRR